MIKNILNSRKYMSGYSWMRQITMSQMDINIHLGLHHKIINKDSKVKGMKVEKYYQDLLKKSIGLDINDKSLFPASFGHLDGYDAGYYSYLWAKVYALDFYSIFEKAKNINDIGLRYRREVLGAGSSRDELATAKAFLGRKLSDKAFIKSL